MINKKKIIVILLLCLIGLMNFAYAQLTDDLYVHHEFENDATDSSGNGRTGTLTLGTYETGKIGKGIKIDASNEYFTFATLTGIYDTDATLCAWISNNDATAYLGYSVNTGHGGTNNVLNLGLNSNVIGYYDGSWRNSGTAFQTGWRFVCWVFDDSDSKYEPWFDGSNLGNVTYGGLIDFKGVFTINRNGQTDLSATVDEFSVWNRTLTATEIAQLYNGGAGLNFSQWGPVAGAMSFDNITVNNQTLTNNSYFNVTNLNFDIDLIVNGTNNQTNQTFYLHNSTGQLINSTQYATNSLTGSFALNLSEGVYSIWLFAYNNETNTSSDNFTFTVDITAPVIQQISNVSNNTFSINFSNILNVTDALSGINSCLLNITELENVTTPDNFVINCTDTQVFNTSGLHNGYVTAVDNAGNTAIYSFNFTIQTFVTINFKDVSNNFIYNYSVTIYHPDGRTEDKDDINGNITLSPINNGVLDLGVHRILFNKFGYLLQNFSVNITETSGGQTYTFNASDSIIVITIRDKITSNVVTTENFTLNIIASVGLETSTITGRKNITNTFFLVENYELIVTSANYSTESVFFSFNNQEIIPVTAYVLDKNDTATAIVRCVDGLGSAIVGALAEARQWDSSTSTYNTVSEAKIVESGEAFLNVVLNTEQYKFRCSFGSLSVESVPRILTVDLDEITLTLSEGATSEDYFLATISYNYSQSFTNNISYINFSWFNSDGTDVTGCVRYSRLFNTGIRTIINETCFNTDSGEIQTARLINSSYDIVAELGFKVNSTFFPKKDYIYYSTISMSNLLENLNIHYYMLPLINLACVLIMMSNIFFGAAAFVILNGVALKIIVPQFLSSAVLGFILFLSGLLVWGGFKKK